MSSSHSTRACEKKGILQLSRSQPAGHPLFPGTFAAPGWLSLSARGKPGISRSPLPLPLPALLHTGYLRASSQRERRTRGCGSTEQPPACMRQQQRLIAPVPMPACQASFPRLPPQPATAVVLCSRGRG